MDPIKPHMDHRIAELLADAEALHLSRELAPPKVRRIGAPQVRRSIVAVGLALLALAATAVAAGAVPTVSGQGADNRAPIVSGGGTDYAR